MTRARLLAEMPSDELTDWMAFFRFEPFGHEWLQAGTIAAASIRAMGGKAKPEDCIPYKLTPTFMSEEEMELRLTAVLGKPRQK